MIEIPKYSIPTYDPNSIYENRRTDFTRRIPALKPKQLARDSKIAAQIIRASEGGTDANAEEKVLDIFMRKAHLLSNPRYWELMRTVWVAAGTTETAEVFRRMMRSTRPCRSWFMTPEDAEALEAWSSLLPSIGPTTQISILMTPTQESAGRSIRSGARAMPRQRAGSSRVAK